MKRIYLIILGCIATSMLQAQELSGQYTTEWQWDMNKNTNWVNQLRLDLSVPLGNDRNTIKAATLHLAQTGESVIGDWQGFSNIDADNMLASIAVLGGLRNSAHCGKVSLRDSEIIPFFHHLADDGGNVLHFLNVPFCIRVILFYIILIRIPCFHFFTASFRRK